MKIIYNVFKKFGTQTDRNEYTLCGVSIEYFCNINEYQINF